jgi:pilus assembly protein CpaB
MKIQWVVIGLISLGLVAAAAAAMLVMAMRAVPPKVEETPDVQVAVAARDLAGQTVVDAASVTVKTMHSSAVPAGCISAPAEVIGKVLAKPLTKDQVFAKSSLATEGSGLHMAAAMPAGMRAFTLSLADSPALEGLLYPGSIVDVLATFTAGTGQGGTADYMSTVLLQSVPVLAVEERTVFSPEEDPAKKAPVNHATHRLVTLMVKPEQARSLQLATAHGSIQLTMRNPTDRESVVTEPLMVSELMKPRVETDPKDSGVPNLGTVVVASKPVQVAPQPPPPAVVVDPPAPVVKPVEVRPASKPTWEVTVIRGATVEKQKFEMAAPVVDKSK